MRGKIRGNGLWFLRWAERFDLISGERRGCDLVRGKRRGCDLVRGSYRIQFFVVIYLQNFRAESYRMIFLVKYICNFYLQMPVGGLHNFAKCKNSTDFFI